MKLLFIENQPDDVEVTLAELRRFGFDPEATRVDSMSTLVRALTTQSWSAVLANSRLPELTALDALHVVRQHDRELPFLVVSEPLGEEPTLELFRSGANDCVTKSRLHRLGPLLERELRDVQLRAERRLFFDALRRSEERHRRLFAQAPIGVVTTDASGSILGVNDRFAKLLRYTTAELVGRPLAMFAHSESLEGEQRYFTRDGQIVWTEITTSPIVGDDGSVEQIVWLFEDITARKQQERELQRRSEQQAVVSDLGNAALRGEPIEALLVRVTDAITSLTEAEVSGILQDVDGTFRRIGGTAWTNGDLPRGEAAMAAYTLEKREPVIVTDLARETRFAQPLNLRANGIVSGIAVPISTSRVEAWGVVGAFFRTPRTFYDHDVEFLRAIATVLAQAIERDRVDQQLVLHAAQQSAIAELSRVALKSVDDAVQLACTIVEDVLGTAHAVYFELDEPKGVLRYRAGRCWQGVEETGAILDADSAIASTLLRGKPAVIRATDSAAGSGIAVPVTSTKERFGVLTAHGPRGRSSLSDADVEFVQSLANILADAMERERAAGALAASEERYREVVEGASEIIFTISPSGRFLSLNGAFEQITGWEASEWLGRSCFDLVEASDVERARHAFASMAHGKPMAEVLRIVGRDGEVLLDITSFPKMEEGRMRTVYGFARDISERRKLETQLEQAGRLTSLGRMAATIAHEFNNVLMGISPFVEVIRRGKSVETSLDHIARAVKRGKRITDEILRFTRSSQPQVAPFEVASWIENIALEARSLVPPNCTIETYIQSPDFVIEGDANQLQQIFTNLILNARDAMPAGGTLSIEILRERPNSRLPFGVVDQPERFAHCIVRDNGTGMSAETLRHIYEPLFTTKKNGTGLGLPVAHQVVQRHGGAIFVESTVGVGTAFHIFLPLAQRPAVASSNEAWSAVVKDVMAKHPRHVLLVEDDPIVSAGLVTLLELQGLHVDVVETGEEAIRAVDRIRPDVVVLDVGLPDMEGTNVYDAIASKLPSLPVIFSTGHADRARLDDYLENPNVGYLLKPYESTTLLRAIEEVVSE